MNAENTDLQHLAKKACISYLKSVHMMQDKTVFDVNKIDLLALATAHGLMNAPKIDFITAAASKKPEGKNDRINMLRELAIKSKALKAKAKAKAEGKNEPVV